MPYVMQAYDNLLEDILTHGESRPDRTGTGTLSRFGAQMRFDLRQGFPAVTKKKLQFKSVVQELTWFLSGSTNAQDLGNGIWDEWADDNGNLGPIYGAQWREWGADCDIDQIQDLLKGLRTSPFSRRHIVTSWNPTDLPHAALPPCHIMFQFYVSVDGWLDCQLYQRSGDMFLGVPFNIASYAMLMHAVARAVGLSPRYFIHTIGDAHIYENHIEQVKQYLAEERRDAPALILGKELLESLTREPVEGDLPETTTLDKYVYGPNIKAEVAV